MHQIEIDGISSVGELVMGLQVASFLPSQDSLETTFLKNSGKGYGLRSPHPKLWFG